MTGKHKWGTRPSNKNQKKRKKTKKKFGTEIGKCKQRGKDKGSVWESRSGTEGVNKFRRTENTNTLKEVL